ncbi:hypothetical protein H4S01_000971 [Coemansia sp. RSA 2610]|nr:hypothetical protein H4S01_000971 [Coemansia sp. RSA 2610]
MFVVDCGWPTDTHDDDQSSSSKTRAANGAPANPRDALSSINWGRVDFVLVSNYEQMTLLPYITEYTEFTGPIYATEPTKVYGQCVLEAGLLSTDSVMYIESTASSSSTRANGRANEHGQRRIVLPYAQQDIIAAMEKVHDVRLNEIITPVPFVQVYARSSGYCIGGANWTVEYKSHRTAFISTSAFATCLHPQEWDGSVLNEAHAIVFCDAVDPAAAEDSEANTVPQNVHISQRINQLCSTAISTLKKRSRVLLIGEPYGVTQDILQVVAENAIAMGLPLPQFIFVSPVAERTVQYGNIMGEWLCTAKQAMLYLPEYPFADKDLRQKGHLHFANSLADLATRNIPQGTWFVVVSPQDTAAISHFIRQWQQDARQCSSADMAGGTGAAKFSVLIHDDDVARAQNIVNRISAGSEVTYVPVSQRLTYQAIEQCLTSAVHTHHVLVPSYIHGRFSSAVSNSLDYKLIEYSYLQATVVDLDSDRHLPLKVQKEMALQLKRDGKQHAVVSGQLSLAAGEIRLERIGDSREDTSTSQPEAKLDVQAVAAVQRPPASTTMAAEQYNLRAWTPERLANGLCDIGLNAVVVEDTSNASSDHAQLVRVTFPGGTATIQMHKGCIANVPLDAGSVDVAVFCLALMGTDFMQFTREANRILHEGGELKIAEVVSRVADVDVFVDTLEEQGFWLDRRRASKMHHSTAPGHAATTSTPQLYRRQRALIFPGQGSQFVGMGRDLEQFSAAQRVFEEVDEALGQRLSRLMFDGDAAELTLTRNAQPAIVAVSVAAIRALEQASGMSAADLYAYTMGHSVGEYSALVAANALALADAVQLVRVRGDAMQAAVDGQDYAMSACILRRGSVADIEAAVAQVQRESGGVVQVANVNSSTQVVLSGTRDAVERALAALQAQRLAARAVNLPVSAPFHCRLMAPARAALANVIRERAPLREAAEWTLPVVSNVTARPHGTAAATERLLAAQVDSPVLWLQSMQFVKAQGVTRWGAMAPGSVVGNLAAREYARDIVRRLADADAIREFVAVLDRQAQRGC